MTAAVIECVACREPVAVEGDACAACVDVAYWLVRIPESALETAITAPITAAITAPETEVTP